ncbi:Rrf2 family protein [Rhizobium sp. BK529]|uniref:Rrf2 family transcriptional regulator n=1 Tax=Rhizobium sp. BK529 TaxID=2586983 RepID=UPI001622D8D4|nr:Rrf2 family transcriptional regulator [Rhizobium sp. BK529]MBB3590951.1 Rrf2 family protein [Rhizobium sp. BK529]
MRQDGRLARMIHVLVHMGLLGGRETSERIAQMLNTNPVVVRRTMASLRQYGIVESEGGPGGGWSLTKPLADITILDVQRALQGETILDAPLSNDHPSCPVERAANAKLQYAFESAEQTLEREFQKVTLAEIGEIAMASARAEKAG